MGGDELDGGEDDDGGEDEVGGEDDVGGLGFLDLVGVGDGLGCDGAELLAAGGVVPGCVDGTTPGGALVVF